MNKKTALLYLLTISTNLCSGMEDAVPVPRLRMLKTLCFEVLTSQAQKLLMGDSLQEKPRLRKLLKALHFMQENTTKMPEELSQEFDQFMRNDCLAIHNFLRTVKNNPLKIEIDKNVSCGPALLRFSPNSKKILAAANPAYFISFNPKLYLWNINHTTPPLVMEGHRAEITSISFSPDNKTIASGSLDKTVRLWDSETGICLHKYKKISSPVLSVCFAPNNSELAALSEKNIITWNTKTNKRLKIVQCASGSEDYFSYSSLQYSPDGNYFAYHSNGVNCHIIKLFDGKTIRCLDHPDLITSFCFSSDNSKIIVLSLGKIYIWDIAKKYCQKLSEKPYVAAFCLLSDSKTLITAIQQAIKFWDISTGINYQTVSLIPFTNVNITDFTPDGTLLASIDESNITIYYNVTESVEENIQSPMQLFFLEYAALLLQQNKSIHITKSIKREIFSTLPLVLQRYLKPRIKLVKLKNHAT